MTELQKTVTRALSGVSIQGKTICVRLTKEGVYIKKAGERWTSAYLCPYDAIYFMGAKILSNSSRDQTAPTKVKRGLLGSR